MYFFSARDLKLPQCIPLDVGRANICFVCNLFKLEIISLNTPLVQSIAVHSCDLINVFSQ